MLVLLKFGNGLLQWVSEFEKIDIQVFSFNTFNADSFEWTSPAIHLEESIANFRNIKMLSHYIKPESDPQNWYQQSKVLVT